MSRDTTRFSPDVGSLFSFVEVTNWTVTATQCTFKHWGGITSNYNWGFTGYSQLEWGESGTWHDFGDEESGYYGGYGDKTYDSHTSYFNRQSVNRTVYLANYAHAYVNGQSTGARAYLQFTVPALPPSASTLSATRNSDTSVSLSWPSASGVKESVRIERSTDGGAYSEIASVSGTATSYTDSSTSADHAYTYRIRYYNQKAYGAYSSTASVTMAPAAPGSISLERADATDVDVTLANTSAVATSLEWQESLDGGSTWGASHTVSGSPVTSFTASTSGGTVLIRVRNANSVGSSDWLVSEPIVTITPPAAPTLISPTGVFNMSAGEVTFTWLHNPKDGSAQTAAQLAYSTNGGSTWTTVSKTTEQSHTITPIPWAAGTTVTWRVRTKGADADWGDWASSKQFTCYQVPSLAFVASNPPSTITALPIPIEVTYSDPQSVACAAATVSIQKDGRTLFTEPLAISGNTLSGSITASELLPVNGESYTVVVTARSGTSLQASANMVISVSYTPPVEGDLGITNDPDTGYVSLIAEYTNGVATNYMPKLKEGDYSYGGLTVTVDADGVITFSGTATANYNKSIPLDEQVAINVEGKYIHLRNDTAFASMQVQPQPGTTNTNTFNVSGTTANRISSAITSTQAALIPTLGSLRFYVSNGNAANGTMHPSLEDTNEATDYKPFDLSPDAESITVIRVNPDGTTVTLLENGESGAAIIDMYAPLNTPYRYDVVTYAASGAYAVKSFDNTLESSKWFAYWNGNIAHAKWNPSGSYSLTRPEKKRVRYAGRKWPVSYDSKAMEQVHSMSWQAVDIEDWVNGFKQLMDDGGRGVYKSCDGYVFHADFDYNAQPEYASATKMGKLSLTITRIDGEQL